MSPSAAYAGTFISEVLAHKKVWAIRDQGGFPTSTNASNETAMPFWSSENRAHRVITNVPAYAGFEPFEIALKDFQNNWLPGLTRDGLKVGLNWSGKRATGYDIESSDVQHRLSARLMSNRSAFDG